MACLVGSEVNIQQLDQVQILIWIYSKIGFPFRDINQINMGYHIWQHIKQMFCLVTFSTYKSVTVVEGGLKGSFSIATTSFFGLLHFTLDSNL